MYTRTYPGSVESSGLNEHLEDLLAGVYVDS